MASRCGCGSSQCSCLLSAGANVTITGVGSAANPYIISASGGGGGSCPDPMTIAELIALRDASGLDVCASYVVTDWVSGAGSLPGPNLLVARATDANTLETEVLVHTPIASLGPDRGVYLWDFGLMVEMSDPLGNLLTELGGNAIDSFPWGNPSLTGNRLSNVFVTGGFAQFSTFVGIFAANSLDGITLDFTGYAGQSCTMIHNTAKGGGTILFGSSSLTMGWSQLYSGSLGQFSIQNGSTVAGPGVGISINRCEIHGGTYSTAAGDGTLIMNNSEFRGDASMQVLVVDAASLQIEQCEMRQATIFASVAVTDGVINNVIQGCTVEHSSVSLTGTTAASTGSFRTVVRTRVTGGSALTVLFTATNLTAAVQDVDVTVNSELTVSGSGTIIDSRISTGFELTTGNFFHTSVAAEGNFTQTLTAINTNTYRGFGANTLI